MKIRYDKDVDAMMIILSDKKLAYESEVENIVIGFSKDNEPIWLEILDVTKDFLFTQRDAITFRDLTLSEYPKLFAKEG